ncbi:response regulator [Rhizobium populisoli]|uniref:response regulator n=1 Tax=Rhizobium populisoli TaxID=2859785 RepID=UPI0035E3FEAD
MRQNLRLAVVDDHPLFREGVRLSLIENGFDVVAEGECAADAVTIAERLSPDILLLDISLPRRWIETIAPVLQAQPNAKIVMLTASEQDDDLRQALQLGVRGYILKGIGAQALATLLDHISTGNGYVEPNVCAKVLALPREQTIASLKEREQRILELLMWGFSNRKIAIKLELREKTSSII